MKKVLFAILSIFLLFSLSYCESAKEKDRKISEALLINDYDKARGLAYDYYNESDKTKFLAWSMRISEEENEDYLSNVLVEPGYTWTNDGNYVRAKGKIRNYGKKTISYFEVTAKFYSNQSGPVIDSDYTNCLQDVGPGERKSFEIFTNADPSYKYMGLEVTKVSVK